MRIIKRSLLNRLKLYPITLLDSWNGKFLIKQNYEIGERVFDGDWIRILADSSTKTESQYAT